MWFIQLVVVLGALALFVTLSFQRVVPHRADELGLKVNRLGLAFGVVALVLSWMFLSATGTVDSGHRGVVVRMGRVTGQIFDEGIYVKMPFFETVEEMSVQVHAENIGADAASHDLQIVHTQVTLNYALIPDRVALIYQTLRRDAVPRIMWPAVQEGVKAVTARYPAEKLITERPKAKAEIEQYLRERLFRHGIVVDAITITDFDFSESFNHAIEAKVTAEQQAMKAQRDVERVRQEMEQKIVQARAEAESLRIQREQVTPQILQLRQIEVQRVVADKWNGQMPQVVLGSGVPVLFQLQSGTPPLPTR